MSEQDYRSTPEYQRARRRRESLGIAYAFFVLGAASISVGLLAMFLMWLFGRPYP